MVPFHWSAVHNVLFKLFEPQRWDTCYWNFYHFFVTCSTTWCGTLANTIVGQTKFSRHVSLNESSCKWTSYKIKEKIYSRNIALYVEKPTFITNYDQNLLHSAPIFKSLELLRLCDVFQLKLLTFVFETVNRISPSCFDDFFLLNSPVLKHNTRQASKGDLFLASKNTLQYGLNSIRYR